MPYMFGAVGAVLKTFKMLGVVTSFPAIEGLWTYTVIPAGETGIMTMEIIIVEPF